MVSSTPQERLDRVYLMQSENVSWVLLAEKSRNITNSWRMCVSVDIWMAMQDILYQLTELPTKAESFAPIYTRNVFWVAQVFPLLALIGFAGWKIRRARIDDREAQRVAALQHEATDLMHKLHRNDVSPREYYSEASRVVRLKAALASGNRRIDPNMVDVETAADTFKLNSDSRDRLRRLFEQSDEWQYSGAHNGPERISPESQREVLELIGNLR